MDADQFDGFYRRHVERCLATGIEPRTREYTAEMIAMWERMFHRVLPMLWHHRQTRFGHSSRSMPRELYPFRYRDPLTGKMVKARYLAERHEIAASYAGRKLVGSHRAFRRSSATYFDGTA